MDLNKMKPEEKMNLCKKYYFGGFAFLPFLWLVNSIWFFKEAFLVPPSPEKKQIRYYVICSMVGASIWIVGVSIWATYFQCKRVEWGRSGDLLTYVFPRGEA